MPMATAEGRPRSAWCRSRDRTFDVPRDSWLLNRDGNLSVRRSARNEYGEQHFAPPRRFSPMRPDLRYFAGNTTVSITWITPLVVRMSAFTTLALSIITPPSFRAILSD